MTAAAVSAAVKHRGTRLVLGAMAYILPPLSLGAVEDFEERIEKMNTMTRGEQLRTIVDLAHRALSRNYPELTRDEVRELIDVGNANEVYLAIMSAAVPKSEAAGEGGQMADGTGQPSTPTSRPVSAGPSSTAAKRSRSTSSKR